MDLVRFSCGCIGLARPRADGRHFMLWSCDGDGDHDVPYWRDMTSALGELKASTPLTEDEAVRVLGELGRLAADGARYRELRVQLRVIVAQEPGGVAPA